MTNNSTEGDFDSILNDDSLESATDDLDALDALSNRESSDKPSDEGEVEGEESEESKLKMLIAKGKEQGCGSDGKRFFHRTLLYSRPLGPPRPSLLAIV